MSCSRFLLLLGEECEELLVLLDLGLVDQDGHRRHLLSFPSEARGLPLLGCRQGHLEGLLEGGIVQDHVGL